MKNQHQQQAKSDLDNHTLAELVAALPEIYQPIFNHPELSMEARRPSEDRLGRIMQLYKRLESEMKRPLRVLDLGCAQGFFSLNLAERGAEVVGIDFQEPNIAVCNALAAENPLFHARFEAGNVEDVIPRLKRDDYDLVLGLSVFHHLIHQLGLSSVQQMLSILAEKVAIGVFEMALPNEPPYWAKSQPRNPRAPLSGYAFVHELARNVTHLSSVARPLYVASNRYWVFHERIDAFDAWKTESHVFANGASRGTRRYYFGDGKIAKLVDLEPGPCQDTNARDHGNEVAFLQNPPSHYAAPALFLHGQHESEAWLVREQLPGELLIDRLRSGKPCDANRIVMDVLDQLVALEAAGLYHDDLGIWNILIGPDGRAVVIDYGAISRDKKDCAWPHNIFLSFIVFLHEIFSGKTVCPDPFRSLRLNPDPLPEPYRSAVWDLLEQPAGQWRIAFLRDRLLQPHNVGDNSTPSRTGFALALRALEDACQIYRTMNHNILRTFPQTQNKTERNANDATQKLEQTQLSGFWQSKGRT